MNETTSMRDDAKRWRRLKQIWQREGFVNLNRKEGHKPFMETIVDTDQPDLCECCSLVEEVVGPVCETEEEALEAFSQLVKKKSANEADN